MRPIFNDDYPVGQLAMTLVFTFASLILVLAIGLAVAIPFYGTDSLSLATSGNFSDPQVISYLKYLQIVQSIGLFIVPPILLGFLFSGKALQYLHVDVAPKSINIALVVVIMISCLPAINLLSSLNSMIKFPDFLSHLEQYLMQKEKDAELLTETFMKVSDYNGLLLNILMIGILPAIGEELFFRGILQRIFCNWTRNIHVGILITSFLFSAVHFQFYGLFPRWILGLLFGYMLVWSGSLWLPIVAHFINNTLAVILYYCISKGIVNEKVADAGSNSNQLPLTIVCSIITGVAIWYLYRKNLLTKVTRQSSFE